MKFFDPFKIISAPDICVSGQTGGKARIKRGQSVTKLWIYPDFDHTLSTQ